MESGPASLRCYLSVTVCRLPILALSPHVSSSLGLLAARRGRGRTACARSGGARADSVARLASAVGRCRLALAAVAAVCGAHALAVDHLARGAALAARAARRLGHAASLGSEVVDGRRHTHHSGGDERGDELLVRGGLREGKETTDRRRRGRGDDASVESTAGQLIASFPRPSLLSTVVPLSACSSLVIPSSTSRLVSSAAMSTAADGRLDEDDDVVARHPPPAVISRSARIACVQTGRQQRQQQVIEKRVCV